MKIEINNHLSVGDFLEEFGISRKGVSQTTTWSVSFREEFVKKYFDIKFNNFIENFDNMVTNMRSVYNRNKRNVRSSLQNSTDGFLSNTRNMMRRGELLY